MTASITVCDGSGASLCEIEDVPPSWCVDELAKNIAREIGECSCKFVLVTEGNVMKTGMVRDILKGKVPPYVIQLIRRVLERPFYWHAMTMSAAGYCLKCMREAGVSAAAVIRMMGGDKSVDIARVHEAGFTLTELLEGRQTIPDHSPYILVRHLNQMIAQCTIPS